jgi:hypothetical protein
MNPILEKCADYLDQNGWHYECSPDSSQLVTGAESEKGSWKALVIWDDDTCILKFVSRLPSKVQTALLSKAAELVLRINNQIRFGAFHLGMDDGDLCFVTELYT